MNILPLLNTLIINVRPVFLIWKMGHRDMIGNELADRKRPFFDSNLTLIPPSVWLKESFELNGKEVTQYKIKIMINAVQLHYSWFPKDKKFWRTENSKRSFPGSDITPIFCFPPSYRSGMIAWIKTYNSFDSCLTQII